MSLEAIDIYDPLTYPTRRDEDWKYSDLARSLRGMPEPSEPSVERIEGEGRLTLKTVTQGRKLSIAGTQGADTITVPAGETLTLFEPYTGHGQYAANSTRRFQVGEGATLIRVVLLDEPEDAVSIRRSTVDTAPGSVFRQYVFSTGAKFQRFETQVDHAGHGAEVEMNGAYLLSDRRHFDLTTRVRHGQVNGVTAQLIKGLVKDTATAVFQGRILVERGADGTDARMRHQALILNDGAHVRAKPELEIYADDVQCAHGKTIGALDEEALFFCMSRGMSDAQARALLTHAFVLPVADMIPDDDLRETVRNFLETKAGGFDAV
ncbi:MAG: SufD family Fe-S cluster assembly protein [Asticcacaulis sp.]|nr:SufD family Fe-S cluster assembly protein [Asticcacaulis sp.]